MAIQQPVARATIATVLRKKLILSSSDVAWVRMMAAAALARKVAARRASHAVDAARISKAEADYVPSIEDVTEQCSQCSMFVRCRNKFDLNRCRLVEGDISALGHCRHFERLSPQAQREDVDAIFHGTGAMDADWREGDHPRAPDGRFGSTPGEHGASKEGGGGKEKDFNSIPGFLRRTGPSPSSSWQAPQFGLKVPLSSSSGGWGGGPSWWHQKPKPLDPTQLKRVGPQMGSNPGGVFEGPGGKRFYVKKGQSKDHVRNELLAADLYRLAGAPTLRYVPVAGAGHVATEMEPLKKNNASQLTRDEVERTRRDFAAHAWTANYDAVGTGGDNLVVDQHGEPFSVDLGGALEYRARGKPKGSAFGDQVTELDTMRDPHIAPDAAKVFGDITPLQFRQSARRVTQITDDEIRDAVDDSGSPPELADKLIKRRDDIANRAKHFGAEGDPKKPTSSVVFVAGEEPPIDKLNGVKFKEWEPPKDWNDVEGQADLDEEPLPENLPTHKQLASGIVIREKDGRVWLMRPKDAYGGYDATFSKGRVEPNLSLQANAIKEAWEETGLKARITGLLGDREGDVTTTRYYIGERESGDPSKPPGGETEGVVLAPASRLDGFLNRDRDRKIAAELSGGAHDSAFDAMWEESKHKRGQPGNAGQFGSGGGGAQQKQPQAQQRRPQPQQGAAPAQQQQGSARKARSENERAFGRHIAEQIEKLTPAQKEKHAGHVKKTREFFSGDGSRRATAKSVREFAARHAVGIAQHHLRTAMIMPVVHHVTEQAVEMIGLGSIPGVTLGATAVAAYSVHHLMEHFGLSLSGGVELLRTTVKGSIDILRGSADVAKQVAKLENERGVTARDAEDDPILTALLKLLVALDEMEDDGGEGGEEPEPAPKKDGGGQASDEAPFEESKHPRDAAGKFASKGEEGEGGGSGEMLPLMNHSTTKNSEAGQAVIAALKFMHQGGPQISNEQAAALETHYGSLSQAWSSLEDLPDYAVKNILGEKATEKNKADFVEAAKSISEHYGSGSLTSGDKKILAAAKNNIEADTFSGLLTATEKYEIEKYYGSIVKALETAKSDPEAFEADIESASESSEKKMGGELDVPSIEAKIKTAIEAGADYNMLLGGTLSIEQIEAITAAYPGKSLGDIVAEVTGKSKEDLGAPTYGAQEKSKKTKFGGLWKETGNGEAADVSANAAAVLSKPAFAGQSYRQMLAYLIKSGQGLPSDTVNELKTKLVTALHLAQAKAMSLGKTADAGKLADAINKIYGESPEIAQAGFEAYKKGGGVTIGAPKAATTPAAPKLPAAPPAPAKKSDLEKYTPEFAAKLKELGETYKVSSKKSVMAKMKAAVQNNASVEAFETALKPAEKKKLEKMWGKVGEKQGKSAAQAMYEKYQQWYMPTMAKPAPPPPLTPPTEAELTKAKKSVALQMQYVPSAPTTPAGQAEAQKLIDAFNGQYAGKELTDPAVLATKVNDFKAMAAKVAQITAKEQPALAQQNAEKQQKLAEQKQAAAKALKEAQEAAKAKNKQYMADLGISETEATGFDALVDMIGGSSADVVSQFQKYQKEAQSHGYPISGFQYALIRNYIDGGYTSINKALRSESWSAKQHVYARLVNNAIDKMPKYTGWVERGTQLDASEIAKYKEGYVVPQKAFTSTGIGYKFGGNVHYKIKANGFRGGDLSQGANQGEKEVLFKAGTNFLVHKVEHKGGQTYIEMEEVESVG